jgi:hypothetical protein
MARPTGRMYWASFVLMAALLLAGQVHAQVRGFAQRAPAATCSSLPETEFSMFVPLAHARYFGGAEVVLNNNGLSPREITSTWYVGGRKPIVGRPITVPPGQAQFVDLTRLLPHGVSLREVEGLQLTYTGKLLEVGAQVTLQAGLLPALSLDVPFSMAMEYKGVSQEAVWSSAIGDEAVIALANTSDVPIRVEAIDSDGSDEIRLPAYGGRIITKRGRLGRNTAEWLRLQTSGAPGSLRVTGFIMSIRDRVPHLLRFYDPAAVVQKDVFATNFRIKDITASMALKNTSDAPITVTPSFLDPESGAALVTLPTIELAARGAQLVDLRPLFGTALPVETVSVRVENSGTPGTLIGSVRSAESGGRIAFDVPLRDSGPLRNSTGSYPWRIDGDYQTRVSITNVGPTPARFSARLTYQGGEYIFPPPQELPTGGLPSLTCAGFATNRSRARTVIRFRSTSRAANSSGRSAKAGRAPALPAGVKW